VSVYKRADQETYSYDFQVSGRRLSGNTEARNKKDAEAVERGLRAKAKADMDAERRTGNGPLTLNDAAGRYWREVGKHHAASATTWRDLDRLVKRLGPDKRLDEITDADVAALATWRREQTIKGEKGRATIAPATVNRSTLEPLKKIFTRAKRTWRYSFPLEPNWRDHWLKEPQERVRELHDGEEAAMGEAMRGDYAPWLQFALLTGLRRAETLIRWADVNWSAKIIMRPGKGGRTVSTPITPAVAALLEPLKGHHPEAVFTYTCQRTRAGRVKGQRYPVTVEGGKTEWARLMKRAGVKGLRFHDLRHTTATRLLRATGNLKLVQQALNHRSIATTVKYAHVMHSEVADALQRVAETSHEKSHTGDAKTS
jgi:integrase